jgi:hypothetical protein
VTNSRTNRFIVAAVTAAASVALLVTAAAPASATNAGAIAAVVDADKPTQAFGSNIDPVQISAPAACDRAATRHVTKIIAVTPAHRVDRAAAKAWVGDNLYATASVGLPGPLTVQSSNSWQGMADGFGQRLVAGRYDLVLRCQNSVGTKIYQQWYGSVTFTSSTAWKGYSAGTTSAAKATAGVTGTVGPTPSSPAGTSTPSTSGSSSTKSSPTAPTGTPSPLPSGSARAAGAATGENGPSSESVKAISLVALVAVAGAVGAAAIRRSRRSTSIGKNDQ